MNTPDSPPPSRWNLVTLLLFFLAALLAFSFGFTPLRTSHDEFWHLKTGKWIAENGRLPANDIFTYTAENLPWHNHEWLTQIAMWGLWSTAEASGFGGWRSVILVKSLFIMLAFAGFGLLIARRLHEPAWAALAIALTAALGRRTFYPRPPVVTYLLLAILLWLLLEWRAGRLRARRLAVLPPMFALWANLHGGWMAGLIVIGAFWADAVGGIVGARLRGADARPAWRDSGCVTALGFACTLATLVNPFTWRLFELPFRVFNDPYLTQSIGELAPPSWRFVWVLCGILTLLAAAGLRPASLRAWLWSVPAVVLFAAALLALSDLAFDRVAPLARVQLALVLPVFALAAWRSHLPGRLAQFLLLAFFGWQALCSVRHLPLLAIVALPTLASSLDAWAAAMRERGRPTPSLHRIVAALILVPLACFWLCNRREGASFIERNVMLAKGLDTQPMPLFRSPRKNPLPAPTTLPHDGYFLVEPYPEGAVNFLLANDLPAPLWNGGNYAGYLIWRLSPEHAKVFTDNRYDVFGGIVIRDEHSVLNGWDEAFIERVREHNPEAAAQLRTWRQVLDHWQTQTLLLPVEAPVNARLAEDPAWVRVYEDFQWILWVRDTPSNRPAIDRALVYPRRVPWIQVIAVSPGASF